MCAGEVPKTRKRTNQKYLEVTAPDTHTELGRVPKARLESLEIYRAWDEVHSRVLLQQWE